MGITVTAGFTIFGIFLAAYLISYISIPAIKKASEDKHLFDHPDQGRKIHVKAIPTLGGVAIFLAFLISYSLSPFSNDFQGFSYFVGAILILFFAGLKDDLVTLSPVKKLMAQLVAGGLVVVGCGAIVTDFHGIMGIREISVWAGMPISLFTIVVVINAVNLIDGIDGLAGGIGTLASLLFGTGFLLVGELPMAVFSFALAGALLGFLRYNFSPASIFMGDTGSMLIGFLLSIQALYFLNLGAFSEFQGILLTSTPLFVVAILAFPLYDTLRVTIKRIRRGKSMFTPGQDHVHHELLRVGMSHRGASLVLYMSSAVIVLLAGVISLSEMNVNVQMAAVIGCCLAIYPTNGFKRRMLARHLNIDWRLYRRKKPGGKVPSGEMAYSNGDMSLDQKIKKMRRANRQRRKDQESEGIAV